MSVSSRIKSLMGSMTIEEFAVALDDRPQRLKDVFRGKQRVPEDLLIKVVERFHCDANWLLLGIERPGTPILAPDEAALLDNYRNTPEEKRGAIREVGAALAQCPARKRRGNG